MSHAAEPSSIDDADLQPQATAGYQIGQKKTLAEYAELDKEDESLAKWKASLGIGAGGTGEKPSVQMLSLSLFSASRPEPIVLDLTDPASIAGLKKNPINIKEGSEYAVELKFTVKGDVVSGLRYVQAVKRSGIVVDKLDSMIGSYGPSETAHVKRMVAEEAPSGMLARTGTYGVRSRITDDDKNIYSDFEWYFKLSKEW